MPFSIQNLLVCVFSFLLASVGFFVSLLATLLGLLYPLRAPLPAYKLQGKPISSNNHQVFVHPTSDTVSTDSEPIYLPRDSPLTLSPPVLTVDLPADVVDSSSATPTFPQSLPSTSSALTPPKSDDKPETRHPKFILHSPPPSPPRTNHHKLCPPGKVLAPVKHKLRILRRTTSTPCDEVASSSKVSKKRSQPLRTQPYDAPYFLPPPTPERDVFPVHRKSTRSRSRKRSRSPGSMKGLESQSLGLPTPPA